MRIQRDRAFEGAGHGLAVLGHMSGLPGCQPEFGAQVGQQQQRQAQSHQIGSIHGARV